MYNSDVLVYAFPFATSCYEYTYPSKTVTVDWFTTLPSFIDVEFNATDCILTFSPTTIAQNGLYTIRVAFSGGG